MPRNVRDKITYPILNFNGYTETAPGPWQNISAYVLEFYQIMCQTSCLYSADIVIKRANEAWVLNFVTTCFFFKPQGRR